MYPEVGPSSETLLFSLASTHGFPWDGLKSYADWIYTVMLGEIMIMDSIGQIDKIRIFDRTQQKRTGQEQTELD